MVGKIVIAECEWWKFNFPRVLILLILTPTMLSENCAELQFKVEEMLKHIQDYANNLRGQWELKEIDMGELCSRRTYKPPHSTDSREPPTMDISANTKLDSLVNESIMAVKNIDYDKATSALNLITDDNRIYTIVNSIYKEDAVNAFNVLLKLSDKLTNLSRIFLLYNAIHNEMEFRNDNDAYKYLILIENINRKVLQQRYINKVIREDALSLLKLIRAKTKQVGTDFLRSAFVFKNSTAIESGNELLNKTYYSDESLFVEIHQEFLIMMKLNGMYNDTFNNVLKLTKSRHQPEQELLLHVINFLVRKNYDEIDTNKLSELFKEYLNFMQQVKGKVNEEKIQKYSEKVKTSMPLSLYNMLSSEKLCIKNVGLGTYLNTGGGRVNYYRFDPNKRNVYLSKKCSPDGYGIWKLEYVNKDIYYLLNINYFNEPVYCSKYAIIEERRLVWTWILGPLDGWRDWTIEVTGDYVYIKNNELNEYLYGSSRTGDTTKNWYKGHVYTLRGGGNNCPKEDCIWLIEDCSNTVD